MLYIYIHTHTLLLFSRSLMSDSLQAHGLQHTRLPCSSPSPRACSNSCPLSQWCHPTISPSVPSSFCLQIFPRIRAFSNESALRIMWPKYWSFIFSTSPSNEYSGLTDLISLHTHTHTQHIYIYFWKRDIIMPFDRTENKKSMNMRRPNSLTWHSGASTIWYHFCFSSFIFYFSHDKSIDVFHSFDIFWEPSALYRIPHVQLRGVLWLHGYFYRWDLVSEA